jgi:ABC-type arginine/histidine transport system permease subunit
MNRIVCLATALTMSLTALVLVTPLALAHAGEEHANPVSSVLHQGSEAIAVTIAIIGLVGVIAWWRGRTAAPQRDDIEEIKH